MQHQDKAYNLKGPCCKYLNTVETMHKNMTNISKHRNSNSLNQAGQDWLIFFINILTHCIIDLKGQASTRDSKLQCKPKDKMNTGT